MITKNLYRFYLLPILLLPILLLPVLFIPFFTTTTQAQSLPDVTDCRLQSPAMLLRLSPILASDSSLAVSRHIRDRAIHKKLLLANSFVKNGTYETDMGIALWLDTNYTPSQTLNRDSASLSTSGTTNNLCEIQGSPFATHFGLDVINVDLGTVTFNMGAIAGLQNRQFTLSSVDRTGKATTDFKDIKMSSNGFVYGGYAAVYGDSLYAFLAYTQHTSPIDILASNATDPKGQPFHDNGFSSIGGGLGFVLDSFIRVAGHLSGHNVNAKTEATTIEFDTDLSQNYEVANLAWTVANTGIDLGITVDVEDANLNIRVTNNLTVVVNRGDNTFNTLSESSLSRLLSFLNNAYTGGVKLEDSSAYSTVGLGVDYNTLSGLKLSAEGYYTVQIADGASVSNSSYGIQLTAGHSF